mgnify:CR=1 FL=1
MIGAFIGIAVVKINGIPYFGALVIAMIITGIVGVFIERVFYRRLTRGGGGYTNWLDSNQRNEWVLRTQLQLYF